MKMWWFFFVLVFVTSVNCHVNVFISQSEVRKLLGLDAELFYVRDGAVNSYAMNFVVPVPANISDLEFMWQSLGRKAIPYQMSIDYESHGAMLPPQVNISEKGLIPTNVQTFKIFLPCTGTRSAEIEVHIQLNISAPERGTHHDTRLNFRRNKICLKGLATPLAYNDSQVSDSSGTSPDAGKGMMYVAAGCAAAAIALLSAGGAASTFYMKGKKKRHHDSIHTSYTTAAYGSHQNVLLRLDTLGRPPSATGSYATIASLHKFPFGKSNSRQSPSPYATTHIGANGHIYEKPDSRVSYYAASNITHISQNNQKHQEARYIDPNDQLRHLSTARHNIKLEILLHEGTFGQIYKGVLRRGDRYEEVAVKTVNESASTMQAALLIAEGLRFSGLSHPSVLSPISTCTDDSRQPLVVYCSPSHSQNLKRFLTSCRLGVHATPLTRELVDACAQVARGLSFLHTQKVVHMDMAARNCVVDEKLRVKVTDNALSRDLFPEDYHCLGDNENRPIKWMAPEALIGNHFSNASDTWSLGVVIWEVISLCSSPFIELDASDVAAFVRDGYRLTQPVNCPDELFGIMTWCWAGAASARPTAPQVLAALHDFHQALSTYI